MKGVLVLSIEHAERPDEPPHAWMAEALDAVRAAVAERELADVAKIHVAIDGPANRVLAVFDDA